MFLFSFDSSKLLLLCSGPDIRLFLTDSAVFIKSCVVPLHAVRSDEEALRFD